MSQSGLKLSTRTEAEYRNSLIIPKTFIEHDRKQYEFSRVRTDGLPLEKSEPPIVTYTKDIIIALGFIAVVVVGMMVINHLPQWVP